MKQSRRNVANASARAEKRTGAPPKVSKYARKRGVEADEPPPRPARAAVEFTTPEGWDGSAPLA